MSLTAKVTRTGHWTLFLLMCSLFAVASAYAQIAVDISVDVAPPPLPVYEQPPIPTPGYLWVPGYWAWDDYVGYYWVPGTWVLPPQPELLWTPGYWGWTNGFYYFHEGYWGPQIGFYGGVAYGFGYTGVGYGGGYWRGGTFFYNQSVNNISNVTITNVYSKTVVVNNTTNVSFNGGPGGITAQPTPAELAATNERHVPPTAAQVQNVQAAAKDPSLSLNSNHGHPAVAATAHPAQFSGPGIVAAHPGQPVAAVTPQGHTISGPNRTINQGPRNVAAPPSTAGTAPNAKVPQGGVAATKGTNASLNKPGGAAGVGDNKASNAAPLARRPAPPAPPAHAGPPTPPAPKAQSRTVAAPPPPPQPGPKPQANKPKCKPGEQHC